jgi:hypothetical protein
MEKRINKKINDYVSEYKNQIKDKLFDLKNNSNLQNDDYIVNTIQILCDHPSLILSKDDFQKRKRTKNIVPLHERCCALKAANEQCTRRKKDGSDYCGTHIKGIPHGIVKSDSLQAPINQERTVVVSAHDFNGIIYYIDDNYNVYDTVDIHNNKINPKIIAKYNINNNIYSIPEFNI